MVDISRSYGYALGAHLIVSAVGRRIIGGDSQGVVGKTKNGKTKNIRLREREEKQTLLSRLLLFLRLNLDFNQ